MKMNQRKMAAILAAGFMCASVTTGNYVQADEENTWAVYVYMCGSDLESEGGAASMDIAEMLSADLPQNVSIIIETGGASAWQNDFIDADYIERYCCTADDFDCVDQQPSANMGESETLQDFLRFCTENYPAEYEAVIIWNHGGGSVNGAAFDEIYDGDSLSLQEMHEAFANTFSLSTDNPPIDLIGFDACLMATIETAYTFSDIAEYMVASEEWEPGNGWNYTGFLSKLSDNPDMDGEELGIGICDAYMEQCEEYGTADQATLSVVDLSKINALVDSYNDMGNEALEAACSDASFLTEFGRSAGKAENYGGNTKEQGYCNLVDLQDLANLNEDILPESSKEVLECLDECVTYHVNGPYREKSGGLSCYYSYDGDLDELSWYKELGVGQPFYYLYEMTLQGELGEEASQYVEEIGVEESEEVTTFLDFDLKEEDYPLYVDEDGYGVMELDADTVDALQTVYFQLCYFDEEEDIMIYLGRDNDIDADWENGIFKDNFRGVWGAIDGNLCYMDIVYEGDDYNLYNVPILLNGEEYQLQVVYDYNEEEYQIMGARKGLDESGMSDKNLRKLVPGDEITTLHYAATISGDDDLELVDIDTFEVTEDTRFEEEELGDGSFLMYFELVDIRNQSSYSESLMLNSEDGEITAEVA